VRALAKRYGGSASTVQKWKKRHSVADLPMRSKAPTSTVLSSDEEAVVVAFRKHTLLPLDDCLYALQSTIPHLTRSSLHRCLQRHGISRMPEMAGGRGSELGMTKTKPAERLDQDIGEGREPKTKLIGSHGGGRRAIGEQVELHRSAN